MSLPPPSYNDNKRSFAYPTVHKRWPTILEGAIEDINQYTSDHPAASTSGGSVIANLRKLLGDFRSDALVDPFAEEDVEIKPELRIYNVELAKFNEQKQVTWLTGPWLYLECYLYQLLDLWFKKTEDLADFDVFERLKNNTFKQSSFGVLELCKRYEVLARQLVIDEVDEEALRLLFNEFIDISLWGNATDLSLLAGNVTLEDIKSVQGAEVRKKNEEKIIVNDISKVWTHLKHSSERRIDIVLDNSGFELFADLCLALFLLDSRLINKVVLHCKEIPWFVSDTMPKDFKNLLEQLSDLSFFPEIYGNNDDKSAITFLFTKIQSYVTYGQLTTQHHPFWTSCENYWEIPQHSDLYQELKKSDLIIFKGDLNYRKLTGDLEWDTTTPFITAIQQLASSQLPILTLRTCKADVVVGLPSGLNEKLIREYKAMGNDIGEFWTASGKWAVISFSPGNN
ncbi:CIC11C00000003653 [Sungouiella intermedia]|uniref:Sugar phosphate phosphatase n=1 Tax=Sungouiella intermedia TaxID=45354 RepID=A0A1L0G0T3_9ASCO|nr:CIC11C00000003653 [[Candida] intermedia]